MDRPPGDAGERPPAAHRREPLVRPRLVQCAVTERLTAHLDPQRDSFFLSLLWWGISSLSFVYAKGYAGLLVLRCAEYPLPEVTSMGSRVSTVCSVLLGIGEAGYYAGMIYYLSFWYKRSVITLFTPKWC